MYDELRMVADFVPRYNDAGDPFTGFVININVSTLGHRDGKDYRGCALLIIGEHEGGELCLYEPGIVLPLKHGSFVVFPSCRITHFNMPYKGRRASIVCHTDAAHVDWVENKNHWIGNAFA